MAQANAPSAQLTGGPKQIQISLLSKVLEQDNPIITTKMLPFLLQAGVAELIVNFIVRVDPTSLPTNSGNTPEEYEALKEKRANTAVSLFEKSTPTIIGFLEKRADDVAASLFKVLDHLDQPASENETKQNIFNESVLALWRRAVIAILTASPSLAIEGLTSDHAYLTGAVRVLGREDVQQAIVQVYSSSTSQPALSRKLTWFTWLLSRNLFIESSSMACGELLINLIIAYSASLKNVEYPGQNQPIQTVHAFLQPFQSTDFLDNLSKSAGKGGPLGTMCVDILSKLAELESSWPARLCPQSSFLVQSLVQLESKNFMDNNNSNNNSNSNNNNSETSTTPKKKKKKNKNKSATQSPAKEEVKEGETKEEAKETPETNEEETKEKETEKEAEKEKETGKEIKKKTAHTPDANEKMSVARWGVVKIINTLAEIKINNTFVTLNVLAEDPVAWKILSSWFFRFPYANIYHQQFYSLVKNSIINRHWAGLRRLFIENKFLTNMTAHYLGPIRSGVKGYIFNIGTDLQELLTDLKSTPTPTTETKQQKNNNNNNKKKEKEKEKENQQEGEKNKFVLFVETNENWKKFQPQLNIEVKWSTPPPDRQNINNNNNELGMMMNMEGERGRRSGYTDKDDVLLDMPKFRNNLDKQ